MCVRSYDLDPHAMTLTYELGVDIMKIYLHIKMKFLGQCFRKLEPEQVDTQTDTSERIANRIRG